MFMIQWNIYTEYGYFLTSNVRLWVGVWVKL
jgi:hypothetical protein